MRAGNAWLSGAAPTGLPISQSLVRTWLLLELGVEGIFGGWAAFLMTMIILDEVAGELWTFGEKPHTFLANALYKVTGVSRNSDAPAGGESNSESRSGEWSLPYRIPT